ncbi:MAG: hypothetical protein IJK93_03775 [Muribaculaceae bacterium]|nr:hypothetical protein [Muribaculaceae bacterium]
MKTNKILCTILLVIVAVVMYLMNSFTPLFCDDWHYRFIYGTQIPIRNIGDIIISQWHHYFEFNNGRFVPHFFVQLFDGILGKPLFNVFNALVFALFLFALTKIVPDRKGQTYKIMSVGFVLVFLLITGFKYVCLWMSGSCNYLWMAVLLVFFIHLIERDDLPAKANVPLLLYGFICGWTNEAMVVGLGAAYFLYFVRHREQLTTHRKFMLIGFYLGAAILVLCPASINRAFTATAQNFTPMDRLVHMNNLRIFYVMLLVVIGKLVFGRMKFKQWVKKEQVLVTAVLVSLVFILLTGYYLAHSRFGIEFFSLLLLLRTIEWKKVGIGAVSVANIATLAVAIYALPICANAYKIGQEELSHVAKGEMLVYTSSPVKTTSFFRRYVLYYYGYGVKDGLDEEKYYGDDDWIPDYYGYHPTLLYMYPQILIDDIESNHDLYNDFRTFEGLPFYAIRLSPDQDIWYAVLSYEPSKYNKLPWPFNRICMKFMQDTDWDISDIKFMDYKGERYALIRRPRPSQDYRLKEIKLIEHDPVKEAQK